MFRSNEWLVSFGDHVIASSPQLREAVAAARLVVDPKGRNVRLVSPNGLRLNLKAAESLL